MFQMFDGTSDVHWDLCRVDVSKEILVPSPGTLLEHPWQVERLCSERGVNCARLQFRYRVYLWLY